MMKRGAILHWSFSDNLVERQSLLLLGASAPETPSLSRPDSVEAIPLALFRTIKILITPRTRTSAEIRWITNVDLKANVPQAIISMVTKKIAGAILSLLMREAQKVSREAGRDVERGRGCSKPAKELLFFGRAVSVTH